IVGFKPSLGAISTEGVIPLAWTFDHVGILARSVEDATIIHSVVSRQGRSVPVPNVGLSGLRFGFLEDLTVSRAIPEVAADVSDVARRLDAAGADVEKAEIPHPAEWLECGRTIMACEAATFHQDAFPSNRDDYREQMSMLISTGLSTPATAYVRALRARDALRAEARVLSSRFDALLLPTAPAPAPQGLASTGDPALCAPASFSGLPAVSLPTRLERTGLPLSVQLVGGPGGDRRLLAIAAEVERLLGFAERPRVSWNGA
ncbi:MAG: amidase, partial [Dehalococcoidia bacterium]